MHAKIIIFEGQDNCLKSTLIEKIRRADKDRFYHVLHYGKPPLYHSDNYQIDLFRDMFELLHCDKDFILDRAHLGEIVWGAIYRDHDLSHQIFELEEEFLPKLIQRVYLITLIDQNFDGHQTRDDRQSLGGQIAKETHSREITRFKFAHINSNIQKKKLLDLSYYYQTDGRINDELLFLEIKNLINE